MNFLLDTCTFLWIISDDPQLSKAAKINFKDSANQVYLSSISIWEIMVKHQLGKLPLPEKPAKYLPQVRESHGIRKLELSEDACLKLTSLPEIHKDPFDRMLICQALVENLTLLTPDPLIQQYPVNYFW